MKKADRRIPRNRPCIPPWRFEVDRIVKSSRDPVRPSPHKTLRKAVNAQKLRCNDRLAYLEGCDGISKTTMWKNVGNCADAIAFHKIQNSDAGAIKSF
jgi:hypothetical protein